jgi:hypothetical protein
MPVDASIPLSVQQPRFDLGAILGEAIQIRQMQQAVQTDNALRAILSEPGAVDDKTGQPTANALAKITRISPQAGVKLTGEVASAQERQAQTARVNSETDTERQKAYRNRLSDAIGVYDADVKGGAIPQADAERKLKTTLHDALFGDASLSPEQRDKNWAIVEGMNPTQLRAGLLTADQRAAREEEARKETEERTPATMGGKPVLVDKQGHVYEPNSGQKLQVTGPVEKEATFTDPNKPVSIGRSGVAAAIAAEVQRRHAAGLPPPTEQEIDDTAARYAEATHRAGTTGTLEAKTSPVGAKADILTADRSSLTAAKKQQQSVRQFSQTAMGMADKVEGMMDRVTTAGGPEALAKIMVNIKTGVLGDADTREFLGYINDLQSENAKIMAGATGSVAQVSASNQQKMDDILTGKMPVSEIRGALRSIREGIRLRNASVDDEVGRQQSQLKADADTGVDTVHARTPDTAITKGSDGVYEPKSPADLRSLHKGDRYRQPGDPPGHYRTVP